MNSKVLLLSVAVIAVGLFAMPSTLSLFAGQHTFYNGSEVKCDKCHKDIYEEMTNNPGPFGASTTHNTTALKACEGCHRTGTISGIPLGNDSTGTFVTNVSTNSAAHAAVTLECTACHTAVPARINGTSEAHQPYYQQANTSANNMAALNGANEACIGCHTHITINITWKRTRGYNLEADETSGSYSLTFTVNNSASNLNTTFSGGS